MIGVVIAKWDTNWQVPMSDAIVHKLACVRHGWKGASQPSEKLPKFILGRV